MLSELVHLVIYFSSVGELADKTEGTGRFPLSCNYYDNPCSWQLPGPR